MSRNSNCRNGYLLSCIVALALFIPLASVQASTFTLLYEFKGGTDGANPSGELVVNNSGNTMFGETVFGGAFNRGSIFGFAGGREFIVHSFKGGTDGANPQGGLVIDASGNLYGTTAAGGTSGNGTIFQVSAAGEETVLASFQGGSDGAVPLGGVIIDQYGKLDGTTAYGGGAGCSGLGCGTVFQYDSQTGLEIPLHSFQGSDGANPIGGLAMDSSGNFYGTTELGGSGSGTVFRLAGGSETVLYSFQGGSDGAVPIAGVQLDPAGNLYGTTAAGGGTGCGGSGCGTVYKLDANLVETVLHAFQGITIDGAFPYGGVTLDGSGNLFLTTCGTGANPPNCNDFAAPGKQCGKGCGQGDADEIPGCCDADRRPLGATLKFNVLHRFAGVHGSGPSAAMLLSQGNLFGTTEYGGPSKGCKGGLEPGCGVIFKLAP